MCLLMCFLLKTQALLSMRMVTKSQRGRPVEDNENVFEASFVFTQLTSQKTSAEMLEVGVTLSGLAGCFLHEVLGEEATAVSVDIFSHPGD